MEEKLEKFKTIQNIVIDKLEGGYYHPNMKLRNPKKFAKYGNSGETMFGIDRVAGDAINKTVAGKKFWKLIDDADAKNKWSWLYMGGNLETPLKDLVTEIVYPEFIYLEKKYLSKKAQELIFKDPRLLFHFIYATWNGSGWFQKFATDFSKKVASGETNLDKLVKYMNDLRTTEGLRKGSAPNLLIKQGGEKIKKFIETLKGADNLQKVLIGTPFIISLIVISLYVLKNKFNYA
jgi:hypothetical protein